MAPVAPFERKGKGNFLIYPSIPKVHHSIKKKKKALACWLYKAVVEYFEWKEIICIPFQGRGREFSFKCVFLTCFYVQECVIIVMLTASQFLTHEKKKTNTRVNSLSSAEAQKVRKHTAVISEIYPGWGLEEPHISSRGTFISNYGTSLAVWMLPFKTGRGCLGAKNFPEMSLEVCVKEWLDSTRLDCEKWDEDGKVAVSRSLCRGTCESRNNTPNSTTQHTHIRHGL